MTCAAAEVDDPGMSAAGLPSVTTRSLLVTSAAVNALQLHANCLSAVHE